MRLNPKAQIIGFGAITPIGPNVRSSVAAARAGVCGFSEHPFMIDSAGEPMHVARVPGLKADFSGVERLCALLFPAIEEALETLPSSRHQNLFRMGLALALPPPHPGQPSDLTDSILSAIEVRYGKLFAQPSYHTLGHAAGHFALDEAIKHLTLHEMDICLIAGVDSYLEPETLEWIDQCDQLHGGGPQNNAWGFIPGEAASAMIVASNDFSRKFNLKTLGEVLSIGIGRETKLIKTDTVCIGEGLTKAFREALGALGPGMQIHNVLCDMNGEKYRADEYAFSALRLRNFLQETSDFVAPADCWGDIGAASAPLHIAIAVICHRKRYSKGPLSMVWASSESGERGATVIHAMDPAKVA